MIEYKVKVYSDRTVWYNSKDLLHREDGPAIEYQVGTKKWYLNGQLHREDGPAVEYPNGDKEWFINGQLHREDGPAIEYQVGTKKWFLNDQLHREDGPAMENANGDKEWYLNDQLHREDGPAIECANGTKMWYINGKQLTEQEFNKTRKQSNTTNIKMFIDDKEQKIVIIKENGTNVKSVVVTLEKAQDIGLINVKVLDEII